MHPDIFSAGRVVESDINSADCVAQSEFVPPAMWLKQIFSAGREAQSEKLFSQNNGFAGVCDLAGGTVIPVL